MTEANPSPDEIPLEDIDRLLQDEDPEFAKTLEEVRAIEIDKDITIEASAIDDADAAEEKLVELEGERGWRKWKTKVFGLLRSFRQRLIAAILGFFSAAFIFLRTRPQEMFFYSIRMARGVAQKLAVPLTLYRAANRVQRITALSLIALGLICAWILLANLRGIWLPALNEPMLRDLQANADWVETYDAKDPGESFYAAFPQERFEYLFPKMKVNLTRTAENPDPMGAFEIVVVLDSKDTAIEVSDREVEFSDLVQRVIENETFSDLYSELGKSRLKGRIKRELDQKLTQGWVKDVNFKTFILKP